MATIHKWARYFAPSGYYVSDTGAITGYGPIKTDRLLDHVRSYDASAYPENGGQDHYWYIYVGSEEVPASAVHKWEKYALDGDPYLDYYHESGSITFVAGEIFQVLPEPHSVDSTYGRIWSDNIVSITVETFEANIDALNDGHWVCSWTSGHSHYWCNTFKAYYYSGAGYDDDHVMMEYDGVVELVAKGKGTYIETVESDDPSTYRENGRQDGYYYVYIGAEGGEEANHHLYATVNGVQQELTKLPAMIDGVKVNLSELYATIDGVQRLVFSDPDAGTCAQPIVEKQNGTLVTVDSYSPANVLSYIQTDGNQFIDTEFQPNQNTKVVMDFQATNMNVHIFGARKAWLSDEFVLYWSEDGAFAAQVNDSANNIDGSFTDANRHKAEMTGSSLTIDGTVAVTYDGGTFSTENNLLLGSSTNSNTSENMQGKIYASEVYDNGAQILDYVPYKLSDGRIGLLDKTAYRFYPNAGTGAFTGG